MPVKSETQKRAMEAAAHGHSTLGIPKKVAEEFLAHDDSLSQAAGVLFVSPEGRVLLMHRSPDEKNYGGYWGLPGGGAEDGEAPIDAALREVAEETGYKHDGPHRVISRVKTPKGLMFTTFAAPVDKPFAPKMADGEHTGFTWADPAHLPAPLHPQVAKLLGPGIGAADDMAPEDWSALRSNLASWAREGDAETTAGDAEFDESKHPRAPDGKFGPGGNEPPSDVDNAGRIIVANGPTEAEAKQPFDSKLSDGSVQSAAIATARMFKGAFPDADVRVVHSVTPVGNSSYITFRLKEPLSNFQERKDAWEAAKGTKRGPPPNRKMANMEYRVSDHETGVRRSVHYRGHLTPASTRADVQNLIKSAVEIFSLKRDGMVGDSAVVIAMDRDSVRETTRDGRLKIKVANISKANVSPYRGKEIPGWQDLGLDPDKIYNLLRDPDELRKAAPSLNGVQLLRKHIPVNAEDHKPNETVGSLGTDAEFDGTYLKNSLFVNARDAIDGIESGQRRELSAGYHYKPDMTPGNFNGSSYDGVMRDIEFNHVALVEDGRAGPDVVVGDSKENVMKPTRFAVLALRTTAANLAPLLAMDSKITLPKEAFLKATQKNFKDHKGSIIAAVRSVVDGKLRPGLALDASMNDLAKALDTFGDLDEEAEDEDKVDDLVEVAAPKDRTASDADPLREFLSAKGLSDEDIEKACQMVAASEPAAADEDEDAKKAEAKKDEEADKKKDEDAKQAMDEAIKTAVKGARDTERGIRVALSEVKPWVGDIPTAMAFDSAADVYRHTAGLLNIDGYKTLHPDALLPVIKAQPRPGSSKPAARAEIAMDANVISKAHKLAPGLAHITIAR